MVPVMHKSATHCSWRSIHIFIVAPNGKINIPLVEPTAGFKLRHRQFNVQWQLLTFEKNLIERTKPRLKITFPTACARSSPQIAPTS